MLNIFEELKCRPKIENKTRWFSQLYVLLWAQSSYKKKAFREIGCPVSLEVIESYIQILLPAYKANLGLQSLSSSIADVLPVVFRLQYIWEHMEVEQEQQELVYFLIIFLKRKFEFELASPVYKVYKFFFVHKIFRIKDDCFKNRLLHY